MSEVIKVWFCKIAGKNINLPDGADDPMRQAVQFAYRQITGKQEDVLFSGWGGELTPLEMEVAYPTPPKVEYRPYTAEEAVRHFGRRFVVPGSGSVYTVHKVMLGGLYVDTCHAETISWESLLACKWWDTGTPCGVPIPQPGE